MKIIVEYYQPSNKWVKTATGFTYLDTNSVVVKTEEHEVLTPEDKESLFKTIYHRNNSLRYCNGSYWKFVDKTIEQEYRMFLPKYNTISNYYGNGVVD